MPTENPSVYPDDGMYKCTDVKISRDYPDIPEAFARDIREQTDRTRTQVTAPFFDGVDLEPIGADGCRPPSEFVNEL